MTRSARKVRKRTKNPFCSALQVEVLNVLMRFHGHSSVSAMAQDIGVSTASFCRALMRLAAEGHVGRIDHGQWSVKPTGELLINCAREIAHLRGGSE